MKAVPDGLDNDASILIRDHPVKRCDRKLAAERNIHETNIAEQSFGFGKVFALAQYPRNEFERGYIVLPVGFRLTEEAISREVEACHRKAELIGCIIIKRKTAAHKRHADQGIMMCEGFLRTERNRKIPRRDCHGFLIGKFQIQIAPEVMIFCLVSRTRAHDVSSFRWCGVNLSIESWY